MLHFLLSNALRRYAPKRTPLLFVVGVLALTACGGGSSGESQRDNRHTVSSSSNSSAAKQEEIPHYNEEEPPLMSLEPPPEADKEHGGAIDDRPVVEVSGPLRLEWHMPSMRENGEFLEGDEIGGYELRYQQVGGGETHSIFVDDPWQESIELPELTAGSYRFDIATFDADGLYSDFVHLQPIR